MTLARTLSTNASAWAVCVRLAIGLVFLPEGIQKLWLGHDWWIFHVARLSRYGFWSFARARHSAPALEARRLSGARGDLIPPARRCAVARRRTPTRA